MDNHLCLSFLFHFFYFFLFPNLFTVRNFDPVKIMDFGVFISWSIISCWDLSFHSFQWRDRVLGLFFWTELCRNTIISGPTRLHVLSECKQSSLPSIAVVTHIDFNKCFYHNLLLCILSETKWSSLPYIAVVTHRDFNAVVLP